jgi:serine/threonine protein phosphatase PrpC
MKALPDPFPPPARPFRVVAAAASDVGKHRTNNEDRVVVADLSNGVAVSDGVSASSSAWCGGWLAAVCDGMGGENGGEIASTLAIDALLSAMLVSEVTDSERAADALKQSVLHASQIVFTAAQSNPSLSRMGTTATVATLGDSEILIAQVGDSRAYLLRNGGLFQLTRDQTLAALLAERLQKPQEEIAETYGSNVILQAVGCKPNVDVALTRVPITSGDVLLLCSDGLFGPVPDDTIRDILLANHDPDRACAALVAAANARGGPDNISCVVARFQRP